MPFSKDSGGKTTPGQGNEANQFAQVGMGGSLGGGQFEQGEGQSGSLQDQQGGTTTTESVPLEHEHEHDGAAGQQQGQESPHAPGLNEDDDEEFSGGRDDATGTPGS